jgi:hypothetical protein
MDAAPAAIPPNPKIAATTAMIKNVIVQRNIANSFFYKVKNGAIVWRYMLPAHSSFR